MYVRNNTRTQTHTHTHTHGFFVNNKWGQVTHNSEHIACFYRLYILEKVLLLLLLLLLL